MGDYNHRSRQISIMDGYFWIRVSRVAKRDKYKLEVDEGGGEVDSAEKEDESSVN